MHRPPRPITSGASVRRCHTLQAMNRPVLSVCVPRAVWPAMLTPPSPSPLIIPVGSGQASGRMSFAEWVFLRRGILLFLSSHWTSCPIIHISPTVVACNLTLYQYLLNTLVMDYMK